MGLLHEYGRGVAQSFFEAARLYGLAAAQGHAHAHFALAVLALHGNGGPKSVASAKAHFEAAAAKGFDSARRALGKRSFLKALRAERGEAEEGEAEGGKAARAVTGA